ncbi:hypothetical protein C0992_003261 [Termitomyces sp. T32_za158]|nr:hypothetical protein C0992_003261 [Termitomyces sp. T32_za158]
MKTRELLKLQGVSEALGKLTSKERTQWRPEATRVSVHQQEGTGVKITKTINIDDLPPATYYIAEHEQEGVPMGAVIHRDCVATYLEALPEGEKPTVVYVARNLQVLRSLYPQVNGRDKVKAILDSGSQIVCMAFEKAQGLGLTWDPDIRLRMESANQQVNESVGLARNVPFKFVEGFTVFLQVHVFTKPVYTVLLGRPFDTLTESNVQNLKDGSAIITIKDPNTGKQMALPTYERGKGLAESEAKEGVKEQALRNC